MAQKKTSFSRSTPTFSLALQHAHLQHRFPGFSFRRVAGGAVWRGTLQPREISSIYQVEIRYKLGGVPEVRVVSPSLVSNVPHLYSNGTLCLYWPKEWRWRGNELISETILPWTALWLYYYELWLDTGAWLGPSSHDQHSGKKTA
jgi:hypothetical protein